jgi:hypothetical protein
MTRIEEIYPCITDNYKRYNPTLFINDQFIIDIFGSDLDNISIEKEELRTTDDKEFEGTYLSVFLKTIKEEAELSFLFKKNNSEWCLDYIYLLSYGHY